MSRGGVVVAFMFEQNRRVPALLFEQRGYVFLQSDGGHRLAVADDLHVDRRGCAADEGGNFRCDARAETESGEREKSVAGTDPVARRFTTCQLTELDLPCTAVPTDFVAAA